MTEDTILSMPPQPESMRGEAIRKFLRDRLPTWPGQYHLLSLCTRGVYGVWEATEQKTGLTGSRILM